MIVKIVFFYKNVRYQMWENNNVYLFLFACLAAGSATMSDKKARLWVDFTERLLEPLFDSPG